MIEKLVLQKRYFPALGENIPAARRGVREERAKGIFCEVCSSRNGASNAHHAASPEEKQLIRVPSLLRIKMKSMQAHSGPAISSKRCFSSDGAL